jgi:hypothetical protein
MYVRRTCSGLVIAASPDGIEYSVAPEDIENIEVRDGFCVRARESGDTDRFDLSVVCAGAYAHKRGGIDRFIPVDGQGSLVFGNASTWLLHSEDRKRMIALAHRGEMPVRNLWRRATASAVAAGQWGAICGPRRRQCEGSCARVSRGLEAWINRAR